MTELVTTSAFRGGNGDEGATTIEEESLIAGPSEFSAVISAGGLEATLNSLVGSTHILTFFLAFYFPCQARN